MKKLRKYRFSTEELANQYVNSIAQGNSAIILNGLPIAQTVEALQPNPNFDNNQPASISNHPTLFENVDFENQYLVDVIWQNEVDSTWNEFEVFPKNTLWRNRIFNDFSVSEKEAAKVEYDFYLNNKKLLEIGRPQVLENDYTILNKYVMACFFNKNGNLLTGESASFDARSAAAIMVYTIHESANVNYNFKLETDNSEDTLKVVILENIDDETPKQVLMETNTNEIKNGVVSLKRGNVIVYEYIKKSYSETNKFTFTLGY